MPIWYTTEINTEETFEVAYASVGNADLTGIRYDGLNLGQSTPATNQLPIFKIDSKQELSDFKYTYGGYAAFNYGYKELDPLNLVPDNSTYIMINEYSLKNWVVKSNRFRGSSSLYP